MLKIWPTRLWSLSTNEIFSKYIVEGLPEGNNLNALAFHQIFSDSSHCCFGFRNGKTQQLSLADLSLRYRWSINSGCMLRFNRNPKLQTIHSTRSIILIVLLSQVQVITYLSVFIQGCELGSPLP